MHGTPITKHFSSTNSSAWIAKSIRDLCMGRSFSQVMHNACVALLQTCIWPIPPHRAAWVTANPSFFHCLISILHRWGKFLMVHREPASLIIRCHDIWLGRPREISGEKRAWRSLVNFFARISTLNLVTCNWNLRQIHRLYSC